MGNSHNLYTWDASVDADAGMLRLVVGLGTRAVDRTSNDHARIVALDDPLRGRLSDADDLSAFSQRGVDVLDLAAHRLDTVRLDALGGTDIRADWSLFTPRSAGWPSGVGARAGPWWWPTSGACWARPRSRR